jgi:hypothetical protein
MSTSKNKQEARRYGQLAEQIDLNYNQEDTVWLQNFIEARNALNEITQSSNSYEINPVIMSSEYDNHSSLSFISTTSSSESDRFPAATAPKTPEVKRPLRRDQTITPGSSKSRPTKSAKVHFDEQALNKEIEQALSGGKSKYFSSNSSDMNSMSSNLFPFELPRSYTSMVSDRHDKDDRRLSSFFAHTDIGSRCSCIKTASSSTNTRSTSSQALEGSLKDLRSSSSFRYTSSDEFKPTRVDFNAMLFENKSIRRPLRKIVTMNEPAVKAHVVQKRVKSCRIKNFLSYQRVDRCVRYGAPFVPKKEVPFVYLI